MQGQRLQEKVRVGFGTSVAVSNRLASLTCGNHSAEKGACNTASWKYVETRDDGVAEEEMKIPRVCMSYYGCANDFSPHTLSSSLKLD